MKRALTALFLSAAFAAAPAAAQDADSNGWQFAVSPYLWTAGISGQASVLSALPPVSVSQSFSDIWQNLDIAGMLQVQARKGQFALTGDLFYIRITAREETPGPVFSEIRLRTTSTAASLLGEVILYEDASNTLSAGAGFRYWDISNNIRTTSNRLPTFEGGASDDWFDPMVGARANVGVAGPLFAMGWAYVGGFGIGSDFMADLYGGLGYKFSPKISAQLGYRWWSVDRTAGDFYFNADQYGPTLGVTFRF